MEICLFCAMPTGTKMRQTTFLSVTEDLYQMKKWAVFPPLCWCFLLKQPVLSLFPICTFFSFFFFFCIQQNKTLSGNNWAGSKGKRNFILGGLIPTSKVLRWEQSTSIVGTWGLSCFMNSICLEDLRVTQWGRAGFYFILAYSY